MVLLTALLFGLRGAVMFSPEPVRVQHETPHQHDTGKTHHQEHCPICFLQMVLPSLVPDLGLCERVFFALPLWSAGTQAKDELLKAVAARGPPTFGVRF